MASQDKLAVDQLPLIDLRGEPVQLSGHYDKYLLLIFLRHLA